MHNWHHWLNIFFGAWIFHIHALFVWLFGGFGVVLHKWKQHRTENNAASWPSTDGVVQSVNIKPKNGYWVETSYRYYAQQEYRYGKFRRHFRRKVKAQEFADSIRGRNLFVRYSMNSPELSIVMERDLKMVGILQAH